MTAFQKADTGAIGIVEVTSRRMSFKGTKFEQLEEKIKKDVNRRKKKVPSEAGEKSTGSSSKELKKRKVSASKGTDIEQRSVKKEKKSGSGDRAELPPEAENEYNNNRTVYVSGLSFGCSDDDVRDFFSSSGEVLNIRLPKWHDTGRLRGYGHVEFNTAEAASNALERSGEYIKDRYVNIDRPLNPRLLSVDPSSTSSSSSSGDAGDEPRKERVAGCRTIFVKNLPYDCTEAELVEAFRVYGPIAKTRFACWEHTKNSKGFAYIDFKREDSAEISVKKSGSIVMKSRKIMVDYETGAPKGGYKGDKSTSKTKKTGKNK